MEGSTVHLHAHGIILEQATRLWDGLVYIAVYSSLSYLKSFLWHVDVERMPGTVVEGVKAGLPARV